MKAKNRRRIVLDTDTYNEVDDQFALILVPKLRLGTHEYSNPLLRF
jgi:hypothetical protein